MSGLRPPMDDALIERLRAAAARVLGAGDVLAAYAHGSRVSGRPRDASGDLPFRAFAFDSQ